MIRKERRWHLIQLYRPVGWRERIELARDNVRWCQRIRSVKKLLAPSPLWAAWYGLRGCVIVTDHPREIMRLDCLGINQKDVALVLEIVRQKNGYTRAKAEANGRAQTAGQSK